MFSGILHRRGIVKSDEYSNQTCSLIFDFNAGGPPSFDPLVQIWKAFAMLTGYPFFFIHIKKSFYLPAIKVFIQNIVFHLCLLFTSTKAYLCDVILI